MRVFSHMILKSQSNMLIWLNFFINFLSTLKTDVLLNIFWETVTHFIYQTQYYQTQTFDWKCKCFRHGISKIWPKTYKGATFLRRKDAKAHHAITLKISCLIYDKKLWNMLCCNVNNMVTIFLVLQDGILVYFTNYNCIFHKIWI